MNSCPGAFGHTSCVVEEPFAVSSFVIGSGVVVSSGIAFSPSIITSSGTTVSFVCSFCVEHGLRGVQKDGNLGARSKFLFADGAVSASLMVTDR